MFKQKKKVFIPVILISSLVIIFLTGLTLHNVFEDKVKPSASETTEVILTPQRVGENLGQASLYKSYSFSEAVSEADLIAQVEIMSWLGEEGRPEFACTDFSAKVVTCYKNKSTDNIIIRQTGGAFSTLKDYPLFQVGDKLLLFLHNIGKDKYDIVGNYPTVLYLSESDSQTIAVKRFVEFEDIKQTQTFGNKCYSDLVSREKEIANDVASTEQTFTLDEITSLIKQEVDTK